MSQEAKSSACLALADGSVFFGSAFGASGEVTGEVVFNTSMTGYGEILTDPSYCGQIVTMTYPLIGNYGINFEDVESNGPRLRAFVVRELCRAPSNFRSELSLDDYLRKAGVIGLEGIDTRSLVRRLRSQGSVTGVLSTVDLDPQSLIAKAQAAPSIVGQDLVQEVMPAASFAWTERLGNFATLAPQDSQPTRYHVVAIDYGMKWNILRHLTQVGCRVTVVPGTSTAAEILALQPDGVFLSNGPGDPEPLTYAIRTIRELLGKLPIFGICLGHQLLGLAAGARTYKLKFGHRGANQPVMNLRNSKVEITSQNHGFAIDALTLPANIEVTHRNLNDQTIEGMRLTDQPAFSVQYHPEAAAGPHDSAYLFEEFCSLMDLSVEKMKA
ncbi:carbamoyl-phosphate synthase, small subunit [Planctopirus limnophila DSM 3776]|uniref:Carbamoyl phosphate synthase small chain n=1 Tax=Planctopirus limnophila (strain ATCC 43296 / DSM 3776 / IFAM 1008 / Mu 290) TaxID=521674 RepID=D5SYS8_PLAL2|nr:glutamine-hydrolyzing carbamoyl-phosphate synthase small subunit [Planctopirus limnophila]ADG67860.1 carbamoyl-phosphate synthase, small subunit [Planctopirus limnophila DSM 3776]